MKISIITAYHNRRKLFIETLKSIKKSNYNNFEVIAVDDCSIESERIEDLQTEFPFLKIIRLNIDNKWYVNPCIPFNIGINHAEADVIIIQNPECLHVHDVISYISKTIDDSNYLTVSTYSLNKELTDNLSNINNIDEYLKTLPQVASEGNPNLGWYNHSKYRPVYYHFCSAITKNNMDLLGGFDERYANGISYDDNEFIERITRLGLSKKVIDEVSVIHQWHTTFFYNRKDYKNLHTINKNLFNNITKREKIIKVN